MTRITIAQDGVTPEEVAAVTAAIAALAAARAPDAPTRPPSWGRAARLEHIGQAPLSSARDARLTHRPSGALPPGATRADA